jgi:release factor glutamine methyltransferase
VGELVRLVDVLLRTERWLRERGIPSPRREAELLLSHALGLERLQLYLAHDRPMNATELEALRALVRRRGSREPLAWILGSQGFHAIDLLVEPGVLVPRPDTEALVEAFLMAVPADEPGPIYVADVGCGSGAIGLAVAHARPAVRVYAIDIDETALRVTKRNVEALELRDRVAVLKGSLLAPVPADRRIDWVLSNPPYIPSKDIAGLEPEVSRWEPRTALDGGPDGLEPYRQLIPQAAQRAHRGIFLEVGHDQAGRVADLLRRAGFTHLATHDDLGGITRVVSARTPAAQ